MADSKRLFVVGTFAFLQPYRFRKLLKDVDLLTSRAKRA